MSRTQSGERLRDAELHDSGYEFGKYLHEGNRDRIMLGEALSALGADYPIFTLEELKFDTPEEPEGQHRREPFGREFTCKAPSCKAHLESTISSTPSLTPVPGSHLNNQKAHA